MSPLPAAKCRAVHPVASKYFKNGKEKKSREKEEGRRGTKTVERRKKGNGRRDKELYEKKSIGESKKNSKQKYIK